VGRVLRFIDRGLRRWELEIGQLDTARGFGVEAE
jgi:hypothetical protein